jgi:hypothetical protein
MALTLTGIGCQAHPAQWSELGSGSHTEGPAAESRSGNTSGLHLAAVRNRSVVELKARDVVTIMRYTGFSNDQILGLGEEFRDIMAQAGAARVMIGKKSEALIQASGVNQVIITSLSRGTFIYDVRRGQVGLPTVMPGQPIPGSSD